MLQNRQFEACQPIKLLDTLRPEEMLREAFDAEDAEDLPGEVADCNAESSASPPKKRKLNKESFTKPKGKWDHKHKKRRQLRERKALESGYAPSQSAAKKINTAGASSISMHAKLGDLKPKLGAYVAQNMSKAEKKDAARAVTAEHLVSECGFMLIEWDGRTSRPLKGNDGRIYAVLAGQPSDPSYVAALDHSFELMQKFTTSEQFTPKEKKHKRGHFPAVNIGFTLPNGFSEPINLSTQNRDTMVEKLREDDGLNRSAIYQSKCLALWNPGFYDYCDAHIKQICEHNPRLIKNFARSAFPTAAFNFGNVRTFKHRDTQNCPFGWCGITALGKFDPRKGGHLILWELKLVIEFPPHSTILIPSAMITHSNTPVAKGDIRNSFTQYCAGGLLRYVNNGFMIDRVLHRKNPAKFREMEAMKATRWQMGLAIGINGLWKIIAAAGENASLHSISITEASERKCSGSRRLTLGVDMRGIMVECVAAQQAAGRNGRFHGGELRIFFNKLAAWLRSPFTLVFVFDGDEKPGMKRGTQVISNALWWEELSKELISLCGYYWVQAAGEGEAELGALNKHGIIDGVITADGDAFVFGAKRVFWPIPTAKRAYADELQVLTSQRIVETSGLSAGGLLLYALLAGGDYSSGVAGCGPAIALGLARLFGGELLSDIEATGTGAQVDGMFMKLREQILNELETNSSGALRSCHPNVAKGFPKEFPDRSILNLYHSPAISSSSRELVNSAEPSRSHWPFREPSIGGLAQFGRENFGWKDETRLKDGMGRMWEGVLSQMFYCPLIIYDASTKCLATPTRQSTVLEARLLKQQGHLGKGFLCPRIVASAVNFVHIVDPGFHVDNLRPMKLWVHSSFIPPNLVIQGKTRQKKRATNSSRMGDRKRKKITVSESSAECREQAESSSMASRRIGLCEEPSSHARAISTLSLNGGDADKAKAKHWLSGELIDLTDGDGAGPHLMPPFDEKVINLTEEDEDEVLAGGIEIRSATPWVDGDFIDLTL